jgi:acyl-CoA synthetase (AMP-forming)/AMP-acid ligase II
MSIEMASDANVACLADITRVQAARRPNEVGLVFEGRSTTFAELDRRTNQVANGLLLATAKAQARIALLDTNTDAFFEIFLGAAKANQVLVPINWRLAPPEIAYIINDAAIETLFVGAGFVEVIEKVRDELKTVSRVIVLGTSDREGELYAAWRDRQSVNDPALHVAGTEVALQVYTSGTTGRPKGAELTNDNILALAPALVRMCERWSEDEVSLVCLPLFHVGGGLWGLVCLYSGAKTVIVRQVVPSEIIRAIAEYRVTKTFLVPALIMALVQTPAIREADVSSLDLIVYGASPIPLALLREAMSTLRCGFGQVYGLTETSGAITYLSPDDHNSQDVKRLRSCGKPLSHVQIRIVDAEGRDLPVGQVGEIVCRTPQTMKGYWNLQDETAKAFRGEWLLTGDAGYVDADGYLFIHDRIKDMIITGGENVYPAEVEQAIFQHPAIADVAVIGVPDDCWGEAVKAIAVLKPGFEATADEIIDSVKGYIAQYKVPRSVDFVDVLPRNASGKVLKRELRDTYWKGRARQVN